MKDTLKVELQDNALAVAYHRFHKNQVYICLALGFSIIYASISLNFGIFFSEFVIKSIVSINLH
jgi:hypothetical protein